MGSGVGVHTDDEVKDLSAEDRARLKADILKQLEDSKAIHKILSADPILLPALLKLYPDLRPILRANVEPALNRYKRTSR